MFHSTGRAAPVSSALGIRCRTGVRRHLMKSPRRLRMLILSRFRLFGVLVLYSMLYPWQLKNTDTVVQCSCDSSVKTSRRAFIACASFSLIILSSLSLLRLTVHSSRHYVRLNSGVMYQRIMCQNLPALRALPDRPLISPRDNFVAVDVALEFHFMPAKQSPNKQHLFTSCCLTTHSTGRAAPLNSGVRF